MAVESDVAVVLDGSEDQEPEEALRKHSSGEVVDGSVNGGGSGSSGSGESKTGSNSSDDRETGTSTRNKIRILVSGTKKPVFFYINLAKKYTNQSYDVELSALGTAIPTVITISEFLKRNRLAVEKNIRISTMAKKDEQKGRVIVKAQIEILLGPGDKLEG